MGSKCLFVLVPPFAPLTALLHTLDCRVLNLPDQVIGRWVAVVVRVGAAQVVSIISITSISIVSIIFIIVIPIISKGFVQSNENNKNQEVFHMNHKTNWSTTKVKLLTTEYIYRRQKSDASKLSFNKGHKI